MSAGSGTTELFRKVPFLATISRYALSSTGRETQVATSARLAPCAGSRIRGQGERRERFRDDDRGTSPAAPGGVRRARGEATRGRELSARLSAGDSFLVAARALGLGLPRQVAGLVPARRQLAHVHRAVLRMDAAATTRVPGYDVRKRIGRAAVIHRHGVWIMPLPLRYTPPSPARRRSAKAFDSPRRNMRPGFFGGWPSRGRHHRCQAELLLRVEDADGKP